MYQMTNIKKAMTLIPIIGWSALGFKRGLNSYDYRHSNNSKQPFYADKLMWGIGSTTIYLNPILFCIVVYKEMYRLEVVLRGLEDEKKTDYYNRVW